MKRAVVEPRGERLALDDVHRLHGFRVAVEKRLHGGGVQLARVGIRLRGDEPLVKGLGRSEREHRQVDHRGSPHFAVRQIELQPEAAHRIGAVGDVRLAAGQREAPDHGHAAGLEDNRLRETHSIPVACEKSGNAYAFGMVATKAGMDAVDALERVGESGRRQIVRSEPAAEIREASCDDYESDADQCQSGYRASDAQGPALGLYRCLEVGRHLPLQSNPRAWRRTSALDPVGTRSSCAPSALTEGFRRNLKASARRFCVRVRWRLAEKQLTSRFLDRAVPGFDRYVSDHSIEVLSARDVYLAGGGEALTEGLPAVLASRSGVPVREPRGDVALSDHPRRPRRPAARLAPPPEDGRRLSPPCRLAAMPHVGAPLKRLDDPRSNGSRCAGHFAPRNARSSHHEPRGARPFRTTSETTRATIMTVRRASSSIAARNAAVLLSTSRANSAVSTRSRRIAAIRPTIRNGSGTSACSLKETCTV